MACVYKVSIKALIQNEKREYLFIKGPEGLYGFPGGGLEYGENMQECLERELHEEIGQQNIFKIAKQSLLSISFQNEHNVWCINIVFEVSVEDIHFESSNESVQIEFMSLEGSVKQKLFPSAKKLIEELMKSF